MEPVTKERLARYISLKKENENRLERLARMRCNAELPALQQGDGSKGSGSSMDRMARSVEKCMEYEAQIRPLIEANRREMAVIEEAVEALKDPLEREVLRLRYMDGEHCRMLSWRKVALELYQDEDKRFIDAAMRLHRTALANINCE